MVITVPLRAKVIALAPGALTTLVCINCTRSAQNSCLYYSVYLYPERSHLSTVFILNPVRSQLSSVHIVPGALTKLVTDTVECEEFAYDAYF